MESAGGRFFVGAASSRDVLRTIAARTPLHLREAELLVEIVDPATGLPLADGNTGEVVFTTLTRNGLPLIRYRTVDMAAFRLDFCACGTVLRTLGMVRARCKSILFENMDKSKQQPGILGIHPM